MTDYENTCTGFSIPENLSTMSLLKHIWDLIKSQNVMFVSTSVYNKLENMPDDRIQGALLDNKIRENIYCSNPNEILVVPVIQLSTFQEE